MVTTCDLYVVFVAVETTCFLLLFADLLVGLHSPLRLAVNPIFFKMLYNEKYTDNLKYFFVRS